MDQTTSSPHSIEQKIWQEEKRFLMRVYAMRLVQKLENGDAINSKSVRSLQIARTYAGSKLATRIDALLSTAVAEIDIPTDEDDDTLTSIGRAAIGGEFDNDRQEDDEDMDLFDDEGDYDENGSTAPAAEEIEESEDEDDGKLDGLFASEDEDEEDDELSTVDEEGDEEFEEGGGKGGEDDEDAGGLFQQDIYSGNTGPSRPGDSKEGTPGFEPTKGHEDQNTPGFEPTKGHADQDTQGFEPTEGHQQQDTPGFELTEVQEGQDTPGFEPTEGHQQQSTPGFELTEGHEGQNTPGFEPTEGHQQQGTPGFEPTEGHEDQDTPGFEPTEGHQQQNTPGFEPSEGHQQQDTPGFEPTEGHEDQDAPGFEPTEGHQQQDTPGFEPQKVEGEKSKIGKKRELTPPESKIGRRKDAGKDEPTDADKPSRPSASERMAKAKEELERRKKTREAQLKAREEETEKTEDETANSEELLANLTHHIELIDLEKKLGIQIIPEDRLHLDRQLVKKLREPCIQALLTNAKSEDLSLVMLPRLFRFISEGQLFKVTGANLLRAYPQLFENTQQVALKLRTEPFFVQESPELDWVFITTDILPESRDRTYMQQKQALKQHAHNQQANERRVRRRNLIDALYDLIAVNAAANVKMLSSTVDLTESRIGRQNLAFINFGENGIRISDIARQQTHPQLGVCPSW